MNAKEFEVKANRAFDLGKENSTNDKLRRYFVIEGFSLREYQKELEQLEKGKQTMQSCNS